MRLFFSTTIHQIAKLFVVHLAIGAELLVSCGDLFLAQTLAALAELMHSNEAVLVAIHGLEVLLIDSLETAEFCKSQKTVHIPVPFNEHRFDVCPA